MIDKQRLEEYYNMLNTINKTCNKERANIKMYSNRKEALKGAKYVVNAIQVGGYDPCTIIDFEILKNMVLGKPLEIL